MRKVVGIPGLPRMDVRELGGDGLAKDQTSGAPEQRNASSIGPRLVADVDRRVVFGWLIGRINHILDAKRYAVKPAASRPEIEGAGIFKDTLTINEGPSAHGVVAFGDSFQAGHGETFGCDFAHLDRPRGLRRGQFV